MKNRKFTTIRITLVALMASMCAALGFIAIDLGNIKFTFESLPVIIGAFMFGPVDGMLIGGIGTFIYQIVRYGFDPTTILWIIPYILCGLYVGAVAKKAHFANNKKQISKTILIAELMVFVINTFSIMIAAKMYGYFTWAYILGALPIRLAVCIAKVVLFSMVTPAILVAFTKVTGNGLDKIKEYQEANKKTK